MRLFFKTILITALLLVLLKGTYAQYGDNYSNNIQKSNQTLIDPDFMQLKLNCPNDTCGVSVVNLNNSEVAVIYGDGSCLFKNINNRNNIITLSAPVTMSSAVTMGAPVYMNGTVNTNGTVTMSGPVNINNSLLVSSPAIINQPVNMSGSIFSVRTNNNPIFEVGHDNYGQGANFNGVVTFNDKIVINYGIWSSFDTLRINPRVRLLNGGCYLGNWSTCSDLRLKKNINIIPNALNKVLNLNGVSFNWRKDEFPSFKFEDGTKIGLIAQDVEKIIPEIVKTEADGYKSVDYVNLTPVLVEAIKEQQKIINSEKNQIQNQTEKINILNDQINCLKKELEKQKQEIVKIYSILNNR